MATRGQGARWSGYGFLSCLGLCLGCAAPSAPAPAPVAYPRAWQQGCEQVWSLEQANAVATARGADGWELVTLEAGVMCFKRPTPGSAAPMPVMGLAPAPQPGAAPTSVPVVRDPGF